MDYNQVTLLGRLAGEPEIRMTTSGKKIASFTVAVSKNEEEASFIDCEAWEKTADNIEKLSKKGAQVLVSGSLRQDTWEDKETGKKRSKIKVIVYRFILTSSNGDYQPTSNEANEAIENNSYSEIPF